MAWLYVHGKFPSDQIDHINLDKLDNRIVNLREATAAQNFANREAYTNNTSGFKGVRKKGRKWEARIGFNGKVLTIGSSDSPEQAHAAYVAKAKELFGEFHNPG